MNVFLSHCNYLPPWVYKFTTNIFLTFLNDISIIIISLDMLNFFTAAQFQATQSNSIFYCCEDSNELFAFDLFRRRAALSETIYEDEIHKTVQHIIRTVLSKTCLFQYIRIHFKMCVIQRQSKYEDYYIKIFLRDKKVFSYIEFVSEKDTLLENYITEDSLLLL